MMRGLVVLCALAIAAPAISGELADGAAECKRLGFVKGTDSFLQCLRQSRPIAQSGAVVNSRPITKSEALSAYIAIVHPCKIAEFGPSGVVQWGTIAQSEQPSGPDPSYRYVIANCFKTTFKDYATYELFEISEPRWVSTTKGRNWLVCVRFVDRGRRRSYALLFNGSTVVDGHFAYQTDACGIQSYVVFEQMGGGLGLPPVH
jgi:hypothetical protein